MRKIQKARQPDSYVAYYRVSTDRQGRSGLGLDAQRDAVARVVRSAHPLAEFTEVETGKRHGKRPELVAAMAAAKKLQATLIIAKLDRLARNVHFISGLMESGVDFIAADMPQANRLTVHILAAVAEHEGEMISTRTKDALAAAKARGTKLGNPRWRESIEKARAAKNPPPAPKVTEIMTHQRAQGASFRAIALRLNTQGLKTSAGHQWHASTVRKALQKAA